MKVLPRVFKYNSITLDDPDPQMSPEEVKDFYANIYPELTQAGIDGPEMGEESIEYSFRRSYGTKGVSIADLADGKTDKPDNEGWQIPSQKDIEIMNLIGSLLGEARGQRERLPSIVLEPL